MVQFGRHQQFFLEQQQQQQLDVSTNDVVNDVSRVPSDASKDDIKQQQQQRHPTKYSFIVPYNDAKHSIASSDENEFEQLWKFYLQQAITAMDRSMNDLWTTVFSCLWDLKMKQQQQQQQQQNELVEDDDVELEFEVRGATPELALVLLAEQASSNQIQNVLDELKRIHTMALMNGEALRKLVKKYDKKKNNQQHQPLLSSSSSTTTTTTSQPPPPLCLLSCKLLPELYSSNFVLGLSSLQQGIDLLRSELGLGEYAVVTTTTTTTPVTSTTPICNGTVTTITPTPTNVSTNDNLPPPIKNNNNNNKKNNEKDHHHHHHHHDNDNDNNTKFQLLTKNDRKDSHTELIQRKLSELQWLQQVITRIESLQMISHLVAHRGFHNPQGRSDRRPVENSLQAYEMAWTNGISLCECDVAVTKDEKLILAHDHDFSRLALDPYNWKSHCSVSDLTYSEIISIALQSGSRPPLLLDVLTSAQAIGTSAQLIIEIKPGNRDAGSAVAKLFVSYPQLMEHCAIIMSFDSFTMQTLQQELDALLYGSIMTPTTTTTVSSPSSSPPPPRQGKNKKEYNALPPLTSSHRPHKNHRRCYSMGIFPGPAASVVPLSFHPPLPPPPPPPPQSQLVALPTPTSPSSSSNTKQTSQFQQQQQQQQHYPTRPKLMVLTVCDEPKHEVELCVSVQEGSTAISKIEGWIKGLDGIYLQYEPYMLTNDGCQILKQLATGSSSNSNGGTGCFVGVWGHNGRDPDDYDTFSQLVQKGHVSFVNTDLPKSFFQLE